MLVALEPQCVDISDCVFEGRDEEDIGAGDQVQYLTRNLICCVLAFAIIKFDMLCNMGHVHYSVSCAYPNGR